VYATTTSLLLRSLRLDDGEKITSYTICAANRNYLFVSTYSGLVLKWDWTTGQDIKRWRSSEKLHFISEQLQYQKDAPSSTFLLIHEVSNQGRKVSRATFSDSSDEIVNEKVFLETNALGSWIKVLDQSRCLVLYHDNKLFLGQATPRPDEAPTSYIWREIAVPKTITSIDARSHSLSSSTKKKRLAVNIAVGCQDGSILIYDDIFFRLASKEKNPREDDIVSRRLHWHRSEVLTVKWSLDGNYIISGGHETVMVIWQLDTGQQQFLPHLSAAIQHLTVSKTGSAYAVRLADNSVMVLSTSELQPTSYVSNLMLRERRVSEEKIKRIPAILHHTHPTLVALAVPADHSVRSSAAEKATLLQTYDIRAQQHSQRQALVRNNITALNVDSSGKSIQEPDVTHLEISYNGKWLASVDEWTPPEDDLKPLHPANEDILSHVKEIFLKFWSKNESTQSWELVTKIQSPHPLHKTSSTSILDLKANPQHPEYSTMSSDGSINIWTPKSRHRNGLPILDKSGAQLYTWTCTHTIEISLPIKTPILTTSALAYSPDGSVLTASSNKSPYIHFIDPVTGTIQHTQHGSHHGRFSYLIFLNHHLITISKDLRLYNTVSGDLIYALALHSSISDVHLAANQLDQTFAVVCLLPTFMSEKKEGNAKARSQVMVFNLKSATPIFRKIVDGTIEILLPLPKAKGYLTINDEAELVYLRQLGSTVAGTNLKGPLSEEAMRATRDLENIFGRRSIEGFEEAGRAITDVNVDVEGDRGQMMQSYKAQSSLSEVFNNHTSILPVGALFEQVVAVIKGGSEAQTAAQRPASGAVGSYRTLDY